ncbi:conserved hypothetical protein [Ricinus communis]|uniref:Dirigent protein n=2 Tax=Ricinus communis TaxID=3988 RepID=B9SFR2_RICCO|nr:conserved hypothetical protein [Ricinus communis]
MLLMNIATAREHKDTKMTVYFHSVFRGPKATVVPVAGLPNNEASFVQFGTIFVNDYAITEMPENTSTAVGRAQGVNAIVGLDGINSLVMLSIVFANEEYNGSTLVLQGLSKQFDEVREIPILSGTGRFRHASGFITLETIFVDKTSVYSTMRCNVSVLHY